MNLCSLVKASLVVVVGLSASAALAGGQWPNWSARWTGDYWKSGNLDNSKHMTCVAVDGSHGAPEYWGAGYGEEAARAAYQQCLDWVNTAERNPAYIEVHCGY
jgi:hypothetical protein